MEYYKGLKPGDIITLKTKEEIMDEYGATEEELAFYYCPHDKGMCITPKMHEYLGKECKIRGIVNRDDDEAIREDEICFLIEEDLYFYWSDWMIKNPYSENLEEMEVEEQCFETLFS